MSTRRVTDGIVLDCDVTGCLDSLQGEEMTTVFDTGEEAVSQGIADGWTRLGRGRHACLRGNQAHRNARQAAPATAH
ncbi:hypothetical protein [Streptomyces sp. NPDC001652]|uniref:hypothetical protein n=1 Tax=Streptomyces sp. NPDC001652 TaxID=3154393 RepID=UPI003316DE67